MTVRLWAPDEPGQLYHERGPVTPLRPLFQGDVFADITGPGLPDDPDGGNLAMLISHPCSMVTTGAQYVDQVEVARVRKHDEVKPGDWDRLAYALLPLPDLVEGSGGHWAAMFNERGHVAMPINHLDKRIAALSLPGVLALQQRLINWTTRARVSVVALETATKPVWVENELAEAWNEKFVDNTLTGEKQVEALATQAKAFDAELRKERKLVDADSTYVVKLVLQDELRDPDTHGKVRQAMTVIRKRHGKPVGPGR